MERDAFLARLAPAATLPRMDADVVPPIPLGDDLAEVWRERAEGAGVVVHDAGSANEAREIVRALAEERGVTDFCSWEEAHLPVHGIAGYLTTAGMTEHVVGETDALGHVGLGITGADRLLAETGSLVLTTGPGRSRSASLVGRVHVVVATADHVDHSLRAVIADLGVDTANTVIITGPSRTADIEAVLVKGVHGPAEVHVILV